MGLTMILMEILAAVVAVGLVMLIAMYKHNYSYWKRKNVIYLPNPQIPFGSLTSLLKQEEALNEFIKKIYNFIKSKKEKHGGLYFFGKPVWMPVDLELLRCVLIKDFAYFENHGFYLNTRDDPLSGGLFALEDENWRRMRTALSHTFTSVKIKMMFPIVAESARNLEEIIVKAASDQEAVDVKDYISRFTMDVVTSAAFGLEVNSIKNPNNDFTIAANRHFQDSGFEALKNLLSFVIPRKYLHAIKFKATKSEVSDFFLDVVRRTIEYREKNNVQRDDFIQLLIQLKNDGKVSKTGEDNETESPAEKKMDMRLTVDEMAAQTFSLYLGGFESSAAPTFSLLELALHQDIQDKVREEVRRVLKKHNGVMTYEACMEMDYLDQVVKESLRMHPPAATITRVCTKEYKIPGSEVVIEKDTLVLLPFIGVHHDPEIFPDPEKFDPERFAPNNNSIPNMACLSFGAGPRICLGKRFGTMLTMVALATVIKNHKVTVNTEKTELPIKFAPKTLITTAKDGVWLNVTKV